jgi:hypothetical protein
MCHICFLLGWKPDVIDWLQEVGKDVVVWVIHFVIDTLQEIVIGDLFAVNSVKRIV